MTYSLGFKLPPTDESKHVEKFFAKVHVHEEKIAEGFRQMAKSKACPKCGKTHSGSCKGGKK